MNDETNPPFPAAAATEIARLRAELADAHARLLAVPARSEAPFRQVWDSSVDGLAVVAADGRMVLVNPALEKMFGYAQGELADADVDILVPESLRINHRIQRELYVSCPGQAQAMMGRRNLFGRCKDGGELAVEISLASLSMDGVDHVLVTVSDITERSLSEALLRASERRLRLALDAARAGIWEWFVDSNNHFWSEELWALYGLPSDGLMASSETWWRTIHPEDLGRVVSTVANAREEGLPFETEWRVKLPPDVPPRWLMCRGQPVSDDQGRLISFIGIVLDVSEHHLGEERLRMLSAAVEQNPASIVLTDLEARILYVNAAFERASGYTLDEVRGRNPRLMQSGETSRDVFRQMWQALGRSDTWVGEFSNRRRSGEVFIESAVISPVRRGDGSISHYLGIMRDVTVEKGIAQELARHRLHLESLVEARTRELELAKDAAESASRAKSAFLANMSHEIRTPLNVVFGMAHIMRREGASPRQAMQLERIDAAAQHLLGVVSDILDLSKIEAEKFLLDEAEFAIDSVVSGVVAMLQEKVEAKGLSMEASVERLPGLVRGDATRFAQALLNLASNAVKFTEQGTIFLGVRVVERRGGRLRVRAEVRDSGIGVAAEVLPRLFSPFEQGEASTTRKYGGTGLGLAITRRLAELMGGEAGARSTLGVGSTFWFTAWLGAGGAAFEAHPAPAAGCRADEMLRRDFAGARVLLVEDEPINQEVASLFLRDAGLAVTIAADGAVAVDMLRTQAFDLVLMDMQMPVMDGLKATARIRALPGRAGLPIVAMTANAFAEDRLMCLEAGMDDFLTKPVEPEKLFGTVLRWLRRD